MGFDIIIVGGGPVGLYCAQKLKDSFDVLVIEKEKELGKKACSGLYSKKIFEFVDEGDFIENEISGCVLHSPSGIEKEYPIKQRPFVVDREEFNKSLAEGLDNLKTGHKVENIEIGDIVKVKTNQGSFESKFIIGADGSRSVVRNHWGTKAPEIVSGLIAMVEEKDFGKNVDVWFDKEVTQDGFLWKIPRGEKVEYGMLGLDVSYTKLEKFFGLKNYQKEAAPIPVGFQKSFFDKTLLMGDAASQTKPWSLGGVLFGMISANISKKILEKCFKDPSEQNLQEYETLWKQDFGEAIEKGMFFREIYKTLDNKTINNVFKTADFINEVDMDNPFTVFGD